RLAGRRAPLARPHRDPVDLRDYLLALMDPIAPGDPLTPWLRFTSASTELGLRLTFVAEDREEIHVEVSPRELGLAYAAQSARLSFAYRHGGTEQVDQQLGLRVCQTVAEYIGPREQQVLERLAESAAASASSEEGSARIREISSTRLLELGGVP